MTCFPCSSLEKDLYEGVEGGVFLTSLVSTNHLILGYTAFRSQPTIVVYNKFKNMWTHMSELPIPISDSVDLVGLQGKTTLVLVVRRSDPEHTRIELTLVQSVDHSFSSFVHVATKELIRQEGFFDVHPFFCHEKWILITHDFNPPFGKKHCQVYAVENAEAKNIGEFDDEMFPDHVSALRDQTLFVYRKAVENVEKQCFTVDLTASPFVVSELSSCDTELSSVLLRGGFRIPPEIPLDFVLSHTVNKRSSRLWISPTGEMLCSAQKRKGEDERATETDVFRAWFLPPLWEMALHVVHSHLSVSHKKRLTDSNIFWIQHFVHFVCT